MNKIKLIYLNLWWRYRVSPRDPRFGQIVIEDNLYNCAKFDHFQVYGLPWTPMAEE